MNIAVSFFVFKINRIISTLCRYNVKIFEGAGWKSIFIDDSIPCSPLGTAAFLSSSDAYECFPLLLEKAFAKYFGSYGHLALNSERSDNVSAVLRMLTGKMKFDETVFNDQSLSLNRYIDLNACSSIFMPVYNQFYNILP
jgi:hypothetical protein